MAKFSYTVKDQSGKTYRNVVDMANKNVLVDKLHKDGYFIVNITEVVVAPIKKKQSGAAAFVPRRKFNHKSVKLHDLLSFSRQLATMLEAGVPLIRSLSVIETQIDSEIFFKVLQRIRQDIEQGSSFSVALAKHPKVFNQFWVSLVEVGEASGTIPAILNKLSFYLEQQAAFSSAIISGIRRPTRALAPARC